MSNSAITGLPASTNTGIALPIQVHGFDVSGNGLQGNQTIVFSGANPAPDGSAPTMAGTAFNTNFNLAFTNGIATGNAILYKTESAAIKVMRNLQDSNISTHLVEDKSLCKAQGPVWH